MKKKYFPISFVLPFPLLLSLFLVFSFLERDISGLHFFFLQFFYLDDRFLTFFSFLDIVS
ncbi:hypothetical protein RhiirA4_9653 [Rhizophagus irregularis]|uniref:Uncharacterized protein n=1 Tax=Rhizophagus irregularis TaxID=588596 RepID=A0A2I1G1W9_9GLOM|nr:hypothetical protein RhiirA4_9653 [Rhizophagus irregularis]